MGLLVPDGEGLGLPRAGVGDILPPHPHCHPPQPGEQQYHRLLEALAPRAHSARQGALLW